MRYLPFRPLLDWRPLMWEDEDFPQLQTGSGLNVYVDDKETEVTVEAPVPGIDVKDLKVSLHGGVLRIYGQSAQSEEEKKKGKVVKKWEMASSFDYVTSLPRPVDAKTLDAKMKNGVVTVKAKIAEEAKPKEIEVKVG